jgi:acetyltransferase
MNLEKFFKPNTVAVIGASSNPVKVGYALLSNLLKSPGRKIFAVSLAEKEILGIKTLTSVSDIVEPIDLAVIAVPAVFVPQILEDCAKKNIKNAIIISAGFKEEGAESAGHELEKKISEIAEENDVALLGPNCLGVIDANSGLNSSFAGSDPLPGNIGFISQSGALGTALLDRAAYEGVGFSKFVSLGNEAQLNELDFLEYLANDDKTSAILMYLEKISDGRKFIELASKITKTKPIVVLKAGRGTHGQKAVASHTGSLAPDDAVFSAACKQAGIISVGSIRQFFNMAKIFQLGIQKPLKNLIILTNGGGPSVVATDLIDLSHSLTLAEISDETKEKLRKVLPPMAAVGNPVDIIGDALSDRYKTALDILAEEKSADGIILIVTPQMMTDVLEISKLVVEYQKNKIIMPIFMGGRAVKPALGFLKSAGISNFNFPVDLVEALDSLSSAFSVTNSVTKQSNQNPILPSPVLGSLDVKIQKLKMISFARMKSLLEEFDIKIPGILIKEKLEITETLLKIGTGPYVMKIISPDIIHKTDSGAVTIGIQNFAEAELAWDKMVSVNPQAKIEGILIQPMIGQNISNSGRKSKEIIIGMKRDETFGPTILFGLGGIFTEALRDTALRVAPVSKEDALQMMAEIRGAKILSGLRGEPAVNQDALANIIVKISSLAIVHPEIVEIDLNPVIATPDGVEVVDARVVISQ